MGHYFTATERMASFPSERLPIFEAFKDHCSNKRTHTELWLYEQIRSCHPDKHITAVSPRIVDLLDWSKAGYAKCSLNRSGENFISSRQYTAPGTRMEGGDGVLDEDVTFGLYELDWQGQSFTFYTIEWPDGDLGYTHNYYILTPKEESWDGHSPSADKLIKACGKWSRDLHEEIYVFDGGRWCKNHGLWSAVQNASWDDVILDPSMKETLVNDVHGFFDSRAVYEEYSVPWKRGIIMHGTPGCGKTISIKALMNSLQAKNVASLYVKSFDCCNGAQYSIRSIFAMARRMAPCLLVFEDLDSLVKDESRSYFLNEVDGLEDNNGILMIGSTNHLERLDAGISKRPSRFDRKYHYKLPGFQERTLYAQYWQRKLEKTKNIEFHDDICELVSSLTEGFSFAYMKELFVQALLAIVGGRAEADDEGGDKTAVEKAAEDTKITTDSSRLLKEEESIGHEDSGNGGGEAGEEGKAAGMVKRKVPEIEVPDHLKENPFLRILQKQVVALIMDMDSSSDDEVVGKSKVPDD
ncbi:P-loop containing nucleoside triphosphate hydrolase protein [Hortaea werneckii]|nr:P-loop containing nucleoside triphosphate hydrolase protein [Hortaea werneckii]KAI7303928.1 P-loop containing nucleoside triphosphate hydrolase protein [Hortaea werneckii]